MDLETAASRKAVYEYVSKNPDLDVLIIGAGVNGIGTFRDLALQDVSVLMIDKADFCSGASAASSHMVHGGIRYLENGEFRLVREAVRERNRLLQNAPHLVEPLPTTIPIFNYLSGLFNAPLKFLNLLHRPAERGAIVIKLGLMLYDAYTSGQDTVPKHTFQSKEASLRKFPKLNKDVRFTATYYDAMMPSPERICIELVSDALKASAQAHAINYTMVGQADGEQVQIIDVLSGDIYQIKPKVVINAAGPWIDFANETLGKPTNLIGGTKGSHLVLDHPELHEAIHGCEFFFENSDGRIVLIYPLKHRVMIGTSDLLIDNPDSAVCTDEEIDYFLDMTKRVFPTIEVNRSHIVFTFSGVRPLPSSDASSTGQISRDHKIELIGPNSVHRFPVLNLIGGKWTTFRAFSEKAADKTLGLLGKSRRKSTESLPIGGGRSYPKTKDEKWRWLHHQARAHELPFERVKRLFERYGTKTEDVARYLTSGADKPLETLPSYSWRELQYLAEHEQVVHLDDLVMRRTLIGILGETTRPFLIEAADALGEVLGWDEAKQEEEVVRTLRILAQDHLVELA